MRKESSPTEMASGDNSQGDLQSLQNRITALEKKIELLEQKMATLENTAVIQ